MNKFWFIVIFLIIKGDVPWKTAVQEFEKKNYHNASQQFQKYISEEPTYASYLSYNAGICELLKDSLKQAQWFFQQSLIGENTHLKSEAYNQLGYICIKQNKWDDALNYWKLALKENPFNEKARYNYELCLRRKPKQNISPSTSNKNENSLTPKKNKNSFKNQDIGDEKNSHSPLNLYEVENILEAMENQEKKFIQQLRKRNKTIKLYDGSDW